MRRLCDYRAGYLISTAIAVSADKFERQTSKSIFMRAAVLAGYLQYFELLGLETMSLRKSPQARRS